MRDSLIDCSRLEKKENCVLLPLATAWSLSGSTENMPLSVATKYVPTITRVLIVKKSCIVAKAHRDYEYRLQNLFSREGMLVEVTTEAPHLSFSQ
jgi:hypothetical protein